jgi:hypothetical protein
MKKILLISLVTLMAMGISFAKTEIQGRLIANVSFTVHELGDVKAEIASKLHIPSPEVYTESWIHEFFSLQLVEGKSETKAIEKEGLCFVFRAYAPSRLSIRISYQNQERFRFEHQIPSSVHYVFYGPDSRAYLLEVLFTTADHRIGSIGPGIRR